MQKRPEHWMICINLDRTTIQRLQRKIRNGVILQLVDVRTREIEDPATKNRDSTGSTECQKALLLLKFGEAVVTGVTSVLGLARGTRRGDENARRMTRFYCCGDGEVDCGVGLTEFLCSHLVQLVF